MNTFTDKTEEHKKQSIANSVTQKQESKEPTFQFADSRAVANAQKGLQEFINNSPSSNQAAQLQATADNYAAKQQPPIQRAENSTGLPDNLKTGMENLSGFSLDHVKVHYNSEKPATVQAHAYAQGSEIHLASGQEKHLPHELGHVVQQMEGRVQPTTSVGGVAVNDSASLENEATAMGNKALSSASSDPLQAKSLNEGNKRANNGQLNKPVQQQAKVIQRDVMSSETWEANCINKCPSAMIRPELIHMTTALGDFHAKPEIKHLDIIIKQSGSWLDWWNSMEPKPHSMTEVLDNVGFLHETAKFQRKQMATAQLKAETISTIVGELTETEGKPAADELFAKFTKYGQSNWKYVTKGANLLTGAKAAACGSFARAFCELLHSTGIDKTATYLKGQQNFITSKLPSTFIDSSCPGNIKTESGDYASQKKFFFSQHWIVQSKFGTYDPTNGTKAHVTAWQKGFVDKGKGVWENGTYKLQLVDKKHVTGGGYLLTEL